MQVCKARHRLHLPGATGSSVPSSANSHTLSPLAEPANTLPAEYATTYCLPLWPNTLTGAFMPAPVWNSQSFVPLLESSAVSRPSLRPTNTRPPAVAVAPLLHALAQCCCHTILFVCMSSAVNVPCGGSGLLPKLPPM